MDLDIEFWLLILVAITGVATLIDRFKFEPTRKASLAQAKKANPQLTASEQENLENSGGLLQLLRSLFLVFFLVLIVRSFLFEPFTIPSSSMEPTLYPGDFVFVNKFHYGLRLPGIKTKVVDLNQPKRGEVMVFRFPEDEKTNYIKRVIGLPGDRVRYDEDKNLYINDQIVEVENWQFKEAIHAKEGQAQMPREGEEDVFKHQIRIDLQLPAFTAGFPAGLETTVPEGQYLVLGDNRDHSSDSRYWGFVEDRLVVGRAEGIWMHLQGWIPDFSRNAWI